MSLELDNDGPLSERHSERRADRGRTQPPAWPVLARLPRIDAPAAPARTPLPTFAAPAPQDQTQHELPPLTFVDPPHADHARVLAAPPVPPANTTRHYRIDRAAERPAIGRPHQARPAPADHASLSDSVFRLHAALTPHMGLVGAMALVLSASLVYWVAIGRQGAPTTPTELLDFRSDLTQESPSESELPAIAAPEPNASALDQPAIDWATPPRVASSDSAAPSSASPLQRKGEPQPPIESTTPAPASTTGPALSPPAPTESTPNGAASAALDATASADLVGITPTPQLDAPYPTTSFPAFSFVDQTPAIAQRPTPSSPADATVR